MYREYRRAHQPTEHRLSWRAGVADRMARPRSGDLGRVVYHLACDPAWT